MIKEYIWEVMVRSTPHLKRKCKRCNSYRFYCSDKFRMNAQKKSIDIWLIYKCTKCDSTYNMTLFSRTKLELINKDLFDKFSENNKEKAWEYAFSSSMAQKNNVEIDFGSIEYGIQHKHISLQDMLNYNGEIVTFRIECPFDFNLRASSVIRKCLNLSTSQFNQLVELKVFSVQKKYLQKKHKVKNGDVLEINIERFRDIYKLWVST